MLSGLRKVKRNRPISIHGQQLIVWQDGKDQAWEFGDKGVWERDMQMMDLSKEHSMMPSGHLCGSAH